MLNYKEQEDNRTVRKETKVKKNKFLNVSRLNDASLLSQSRSKLTLRRSYFEGANVTSKDRFINN